MSTGMKKIDFTKFEIVDITGKPADIGEVKLYESIGNVIYNDTTSIALAEIAKRIHTGKVVEFRDNEVQEIKEIIEKSGFAPLMKRQLLEFIDNVK